MLRSYAWYKGLLLIISIIIVLLFVYYSVPIDKNTALLSYDALHNSFYGEDCLLCAVVYSSVTIITVLLILHIAYLFLQKQHKAAMIVLLSLLLGPGLIINVLGKNHWGRPRPYQVLRHQADFAPVWQHDFHKPNNNSFPSGHAAIGFFVGVPFFVLGRKKTGVLLSLLLGSTVGVVRIMQGGHYVSDVFCAGIIVWLITLLIIWLVDRVR